MATAAPERAAILIVGSPMFERVLERQQPFKAACTAIGEALAEAGFSIVAGSFDDETADAWVIRGVMQVDARLAKVILPGPDAEGGVPAEFTSIAVEVTAADWNETRLEQLRKADAVLLLGGKGGTRAIYEAARVHQKPMLAIPTFGGVAHEVAEQVQQDILRRGIVTHDLSRLDTWTDRSAELVAETLRAILGPRRTPSSYLLTWDPELTSFEAFRAAAESRGDNHRMTWSASSEVLSGDRVYLMRHGGQPGIVGTGTAVSSATERPHWNPARAASGEKAWFVAVEWRLIGEYPLIPLETLMAATGERELWTRQGTGHRMSPDLAERITALLAQTGTPSTSDFADPKAGLVSIERLSEYRTSPSVKRVLDRAIALAAQPRGADAAVTASLLLIAVYRDESQGTAFEFLRRMLAEGNVERGARAIEDYFPYYAVQSGPPIERPRAGNYPIGWLSTPVVDFLQRAREYARTASASDVIQARHLVAAIIQRSFDASVVPGPGTRFLLERFEIDEVVLREKFIAWLDSEDVYLHGDDKAHWRRIFARVERTEHTPQHTMPHFELESSRGRDLLKIDRDVNPLAALMAAQTLEPPLAIGLFGDWGSGKSFFMEKLRERIDYLATETRRRSSDDKPSAFHGEVAQITFNAWNYVEANLWASLVTHIFESLHQKFAPPEAGETEHWRALLERMDKESTVSKEMQAELEAAQRNLAAAQADQSAMWRHVAEATEQLWITLAARHPEIKELDDVLQGDDVRAVRNGLLQRREEANALLSQLGLVRTSFVESLGSLRAMGIAGAVFVLIVLLILAGAFCLDKGLLATIGDGISTASAFAGAALAWLGTAFRKASKVVASVQEVADTFHRSLVDNKVDDTKLLTAKREMEAASRRVEEHKERVVALRAQISELQPSRRLTSFLANRAESQDYRKHLGLPAMIRRDFERLQALMDQMQTRSFKLEPDALKEVVSQRVPRALFDTLRTHQIYLPDDATVAADRVVRHPDVDYEVRIDADGDCQIVWNRVRIDRIVLYIDDLDRCPSERVVEVLQAVRLLLDFKLFVVVVGVDARWVTQALRAHHAQQWRGAKRDRDIDAPEPQDFLEKIFQVPLWLEPLDTDATKGYLRGLTDDTVRKRSVEEERRVEPNPQGSAPMAAATTPRAPTTIVSASEVVQDQAAALDAIPGVEVAAVGQGGQTAATALIAKVQEPEAPPPDEVMNPAGLEMEEWERDFMLELADLIGRSPRAVKRFVNVYRLIRSSLPSNELPAFTGTKDVEGAYQVVQLLLAVVVGKPAVAEDLFHALRQPDCEPLLVLARARTEDATLSQHKRDEWSDVVAFLEPSRHDTAVCSQAFVDARWFERVSRYSFRVGRR